MDTPGRTEGADAAVRLAAGRWVQVREILESALEVEPLERAGFVDRACGPDGDLRAEIQTLLRTLEESPPS